MNRQQRCSRCKATKPAAAFGLADPLTSRLHRQCHDCRAAVADAQAERHRERQRRIDAQLTGEPVPGPVRHVWQPVTVARLDAAIEAGLTLTQAAQRLRLSHYAVWHARHKFMLERSTDRFLSALTVGKQLGVHPHRVSEWLRAGHLGGAQQPRAGYTNYRWLVTEADMLNFLAAPEHWHRWAPEAITDPELRAWATDLRGGAWLTVKEVARLFHVGPHAIAEWCQRGLVVAERLHDGVRGPWRIKASSLVGFVPPSCRPRGAAAAQAIPTADADAIYADWQTGRLSLAGISWWWGVSERDVRRLIAEREQGVAA